MIAEPERAVLVSTLREVVSRSRFATLDELGTELPGRPRRGRISEVIGGTGRFPDRHEVSALVEVCDSTRTAEIGRLWDAAAAERSTSAVTASAFSAVAVVGVVGTFRDWDALGVHRPITRLSSSIDLTDRVDGGGLPSYVLRETDLDPSPKTGLRADLAAAAAGTGAAARLVVITGESWPGRPGPRSRPCAARCAPGGC